ncbi:MAG: hypothetical protein EX271_06380, partial [Acidimicrobiales bacterium]
MTTSLRNILLATVAGFSLAACGGGTTSSPGSAVSVTVGSGGSSGGGTSAGADRDLVPNDACPTGTTIETITIASGATVEACAITGTITE